MIFERRAVDNWPQRSGNGSRHNRSRLLLACIASTLLACRLIEPGADESLPVFVEVPIGNHIVPLPHLCQSVIDHTQNDVNYPNQRELTQTKTYQRMYWT